MGLISQLVSSHCSTCACNPPGPPTYCGWYGDVGSPGSYCFYGIPTNTGAMDTFRTNVNAYDMSSIPAGHVRNLDHDNLGNLTGTHTDYLLTARTYVGYRCPVGGGDTYDPFFQGAAGVPVLQLSSFIYVYFQCGVGGADYIVNSMIRCAMPATTGALQDFDYYPQPGDPSTANTCQGLIPGFSKVTCADLVNATDIPIAALNLSAQFDPTLCTNVGYWMKFSYMFAGYSCSSDP